MENIQAEIKEEIEEFNKLIKKYPHIAELFDLKPNLAPEPGKYFFIVATRVPCHTGGRC